MTETKLIYPIGNYSIFLLQDSEESPNLACAALLILLVLTLILNSFVVLSILWSPLRSNAHTASIATIVSVSLVDGVFNLTSSIVFHASWSELPHFYGEDTVRVWCKSNAAILQVTGMVLSFALAVLSYDRLCVVNERRTGDVPFRRKEKLQVGLKWVLLLSIFGSAILALPLALGALTTTLFEQRMSCSPAYASKQPEGVLIAVSILATYLTTWLFIIRISYVIAKKILDERRRLVGLELVARQRAVERGSPQRGITNSNSELWSHVWGAASEDGLPTYALTALLIASFMLAVVPNIVAVQVTQFYNTYDIAQEVYVMNRTFPEMRQIRTDVFDSIFAWTRHGYNVFSPGLILFMHSEIRRQCKITFCCCFVGGNNIPVQPRSVPAFVREWKWQKKKKTVADYRTPVLFATSQGLHLRTVRGDGPEEEEPQFFIKFCDLTLEDVSAPSTRQTPVEVKPRQESKLSETFVVKQNVRSFGDTFVKSPNDFDISKSTRNRCGTIELALTAENGGSLLSLSQRVRNRDS